MSGRGVGLTTRGLAFLCVGLAVAVGGVAVGHRDVVWAGAFLVAVPLLGLALVSLGRRVRPSVRTLSPVELPAGEVLTGRLRVRPTPWGATTTLTEALPWGMSPTFRLVQRPGPAPLVLSYSARPTRRGVFVVGPAVWRFEDPFGFAQAQHLEPDTAEVVVTPTVHALNAAGPGMGTLQSGEADRHHSSKAGPDDMLVREYRPGDDLRRIHWGSTARTGEVMVRREERASEPNALIVVDNRSSAHAGTDDLSTLEWGVSLVASLAVNFIHDGYSIAVADNTGALLVPSGPGPQRVRGVLRHLAELRTVPLTSLAPAAKAFETDRVGSILIAVTGRLRLEDARYLATAGRGRSTRWAFVQEVTGDASTDACQILVADGWRVTPVPPGTTVSQAWAEHRLGALR